VPKTLFVPLKATLRHELAKSYWCDISVSFILKLCFFF